MGYYKNIEIEGQEDIDRIVAWYSAFGHKYTADEMSAFLADESTLWQAIRLWEKSLKPIQLSGGLPKPRPASSHVALAETRKQRRAREKAAKTITITSLDFAVMVGSIAAFGITAIGLLLWLSRLV